jgi:hypothetical protein
MSRPSKQPEKGIKASSVAYKFTDVSVERIVSIFGVKAAKKGK